MADSRNYSTDCRIVGDYVDNAGHSDGQRVSHGEPVATRIVGEFFHKTMEINEERGTKGEVDGAI